MVKKNMVIFKFGMENVFKGLSFFDDVSFSIPFQNTIFKYQLQHGEFHFTMTLLNN